MGRRYFMNLPSRQNKFLKAAAKVGAKEIFTLKMVAEKLGWTEKEAADAGFPLLKPDLDLMEDVYSSIPPDVHIPKGVPAYRLTSKGRFVLSQMRDDNWSRRRLIVWTIVWPILTALFIPVVSERIRSHFNPTPPVNRN